jgi:hypothetical protein
VPQSDARLKVAAGCARPQHGGAGQIAAAADHQHLVDAGVSGDTSEIGVELGVIGDRTRRAMTHRHEAFGADAPP